jgi:hypothetical protein
MVFRPVGNFSARIMAILCNALRFELQCRISDLTVCMSGRGSARAEHGAPACGTLPRPGGKRKVQPD